MTNLYGFTFMRGVDRLDYPYMEMLKSMSGITSKIYVALGESSDQTAEKISTLANVEIIKTTWEDRYMGDGGKIFAQQANIALDKLRAAHGDEEDAWALFLHCDEIIHPDEYSKLLQDLQLAISTGADAIRLRFLHFWKDHYHIASNKRWQPAEIRLFKLKSDILCYGDAQGFHQYQKQIDSEVNLFHYGHVRPAEQHRLKQEEIMRRIRAANKFNKYWKRERRAFAKTKMLAINCHHPNFMRPRIERLNDQFDLPTKKVIHLVGNPDEYSNYFKDHINVENIYWHQVVQDVPAAERKERMVITQPRFWQHLLYQQPLSGKMESPSAEEWSKDMELLLRLSDKGYSQKGS